MDSYGGLAINGDRELCSCVRTEKTFTRRYQRHIRNTFWNSGRTEVECYNTIYASLPTSRQQVVFALLVPSCQQVWNKLLTTCNNLVDIIRLIARLFQQIRYSHDITILLQPCVVNLVTFLLYHDCIRLVRTTLWHSCYIMTVSDLLEQPCDKSDSAIKLATSC
jgi:hypothetical protein